VKATDAEVLQRMSRDHDDRYNHDLIDAVELVKATVNALGDGKIAPMEISKSTNEQHLLFATSFVPGTRSAESTDHHRYTQLSIAKFLGMTQPNGTTPQEKVRTAFQVLELFERGIWDGKKAHTYFHQPEGELLPAEKIKNAATLALDRQKERADRRHREAQTAVEKHEVVITGYENHLFKARKSHSLAACRRSSSSQ
jgi:hypothetical protein